MKKSYIILSFFIYLITNNNYGWDSTIAKYYPLAIGNTWSYHHVGLYTTCSVSYVDDFIVKIVSDTVLPNNKKYFKFNDGRLERIDSNSMNVYRYYPADNSEFIMDSLNCKLMDSVKTHRGGCTSIWEIGFYIKYNVYDTNIIIYDNIHWNSKRFDALYRSYRLVKGIGIYSQRCCNVGGHEVTLNGCIINGIQYGQIVGTESNGEFIPVKYSLFQNFPNPFNPVTNIEFDLPEKSFVKLIIYGILGNEIEYLVKEELLPGKYNSLWDASKYSSGVYYYQLITDTYTETKKMVLIK